MSDSDKKIAAKTRTARAGIIRISAMLFYNRLRVVFMPCRVGLKDEHRTSNVQRRTSNNDVAPLRNLISSVFINTMSNLE